MNLDGILIILGIVVVWLVLVKVFSKAGIQPC